MSWYPPPPPPHYAQDYAAAGYPPQPHYGATATPGYAAPPPQQQQQGGYAYGAAAGHYAQPPPPPPVGYYQPPPAAYPQPQPQQPPIMHHHHHQQQPRYPDYAAPAPAPPPPVQHQYTPPPPPVTAPPLKEGELRPPPDVAHDPNSFRRYFKQQLDHLTYNSKPVITSLTLFAHEHAIRMASVVAQCFDEHLRTCPPQYLLPAFYLLDSICKNIGAPYIALFSRFIERAFLSAYHAVDPLTRTKLEELLGTWKTGGNDGGELFREPDEPREGARVQRGIEAALFGARGRGDGLGGRATKDAEMYHAGVQQLPHTATTTERSGVLYDVRRLLTLRQETAAPSGNTSSSSSAAAAVAADQINASQIVALKKLEHLILNTQLTTEQVTQIRNQLQALAPPPPPTPAGRGPSASPLPLAAATVPTSTTTATILSPLVQQQQQQAYPPPPPPPSMPHSYVGQQHLSPPPPLGPQQQQYSYQQQQSQPPRQFSPHPAAPTPPPPPPPPAAASPALAPASSNPTPGVVNGIDLGLLSQLSASGALANLFGSGVRGGSASPALAHATVEQKPDVLLKVEDGGNATTPTTTTATRREKVPLVEKDEMAAVWEQEAIRFGVTLNSGDLATPRPHALAVLYLQLLPLQCRQCGLRQPESRAGKRKMDEHLDWHFVHKRRMREAAGRASGRSWFTSEEDWYTSDATHHPLSAADQPSSALLSAGAAATAAAAASQPGAGGTIDRTALQKLKVAVPAAGTPEAALGLGDKPCPICQDRFKSEWSDEEEEWVWWNAVVVDKVLYHATCHAEAALSRSNAVAASASAAASRASLRTSRESTPNIPAAGSRKRKADSVDPASANEVTQSTASSPLKPKVEGEGDGTQSGGGTDEPDPKRVKAEPQEEQEQVNAAGMLDPGANTADGALEQQPAVAEQASVTEEISREPTPPVFSEMSSLFLPE